MCRKRVASCPSAYPSEGSQLLGVVNAAGRIDYIGNPLPVSKKFIEIISESKLPPGKRFRFTSDCQKSGCGRWESNSCSVARAAAQLRQSQSTINDAIPECGIRPTCRWFNQEGRDVCHICPEVVRDV